MQADALVAVADAEQVADLLGRPALDVAQHDHLLLRRAAARRSRA